MCNSKEFYDRILEGWKRSETVLGIPYYINHNSEKTQWDHPILVKTMEELVDMEGVKYSAYRTAMKLRFLQKRFGLDLIDVRTIGTVFDRHGYKAGQSEAAGEIDARSVYIILVDIYNMGRKKTTELGRINPDTLAEITLNWLLNLYDMNRSGHLKLLAVKTALATLCAARLSEKYKYFFSLVSSSTNHASKRNMIQLLQSLMQVPELISESTSFGGLNVSPAVDNCFSVAWNEAGVTVDEFIAWMMKEPQTIVWLPTMHRLAAAESVKHEAKCSICKAFPIVGFRYRCLKCFNYDLCQQCFFTGRVSKRHKTRHPTQEYCLAATTKEDTKDFMRTIRNNLSKKHRQKNKPRYLPIHGTEEPYDMDSYSENQKPITEPMVLAILTDSEEETLPKPGTKENQVQQENRPPKRSPKSREMPQKSGRSEDHGDSGVLSKAPSVLEPNKDYGPLVHQLERENRHLMREIERLHIIGQRQPPPPSYRSTDSDDEEKEWLREEREKMEAKQEVLDAHNKQLELQLHRLRLLLRQDEAREPFSQLSQNVPSSLASPQSHIPKKALPPATQYNPPPPYQRQSPGQPLSQSLISAGPPDQSQGSLYPLDRTGATWPYDSLDMLEVDITYGKGDQTHVTLPSPNQSRCFPDEEAELEAMIDKLNKEYSYQMSDSVHQQPHSALEDMYRAAHKLGDAFTGFVGNLQQKEYEDLDNISSEQPSDITDLDDSEKIPSVSENLPCKNVPWQQLSFLS